MLNKSLALVALVIFAAGCGLETRTYVMDKPRVGIDLTSGNGGCLSGKCPPQTISKTTRRVYVLEITRPVPESEVRKMEETAVNAIVDNPTVPAVENTPPANEPTAAAPEAQPAAPVVPVVGELPGTSAEPETNSETATAAPAAAAEQNSGSIQATTYTVQKDDTLQKISKKVFGTYSKWYKIYKANKDKIENPNVLKPGTVLNIPSVK